MLAIMETDWSHLRLELNLLKSLRRRRHELKISSAIQPRRKERSSAQCAAAGLSPAFRGVPDHSLALPNVMKNKDDA